MPRNTTREVFFSILLAMFILSCKKDLKNNIPSAQNPGVINNRESIPSQLIPLGTLSQPRTGLSAVSAGDVLLFAGGKNPGSVYFSRVDIYDRSASTWTTAELGEARSGIAVTVLGKKVFFAGGQSSKGFSSLVDIYDIEAKTWTTKVLNDVAATMAAASTGNKAVFASGITAHIYDATSGTWSTARLSEREGEGNCCQQNVSGLMATATAEYIYLAGGVGWETHNDIDIYHAPSNTWSSSKLSEYKGNGGSIAVNNINYWAGGHAINSSLSSGVEIMDMSTGARTTGSLFQPNAGFTTVRKNNTIVFFTGTGLFKDKFDIYNTATKVWSIGTLPVTIEAAAIASTGDALYVAGGVVNGSVSDKVQRLEF